MSAADVALALLDALAVHLLVQHHRRFPPPPPIMQPPSESAGRSSEHPTEARSS